VKWKWRVLGLIIALVLAPALLLGGMSAMARRPDNLGPRDGRLAVCPASPNCVCSQAADDAHAIEPLHFSDDPAAAMRRLRTMLETMPRTTVVTVRDDYLHAECRSLLFRFTDDVEFLLDPETRVIHCRSASRVGYSDLGVNRQRIESIRAAFEQI
jgi:uncharacterized protein (DUF1499 family)